MNAAQRTGLLTLIEERQRSGGTTRNGTAPVTVQIGYVNDSNMVCDDGVLIIAASPAIVYDVLDWVRGQDKTAPYITAGMVDMQSGPGLHSRTRGLLVS